MNQEICSAETINYTTEENQKIQNTKHSGSFENTLDTATDTQKIFSLLNQTHICKWMVERKEKNGQGQETGDTSVQHTQSATF